MEVQQSQNFEADAKVNIYVFKYPETVAEACNLSALEGEWGDVRNQGQPQFHSKFKASLGFV